MNEDLAWLTPRGCTQVAPCTPASLSLDSLFIRMVSHNILTCQLEFLLLTKHRYIAKWGEIDINIPYSALTLQSSRFYLYLVFLVQVGNSNLTKARLNESAIQCDKIGRNFSTLVKFFKSLAIFWGFTFAKPKFCNFLSYRFGNIFSLLSITKYWKNN